MTTFQRFSAAATLAGAIAAAGLATANEGPGRGAGGPLGFGPGGVDFAAIDANGDGALSREELTQRATSRIAIIDVNGDGQATRAELIEAMPAREGFRNVFAADPAEAMADRTLAMNGGTAAGAVSVATLAEQQVNMLLTRLDADRNDALSLAEAEDGPHGRRADREGRGGPDGRPRF